MTFPTAAQSLAAIADHLATRREAILQAWLRAADQDPEMTSVLALTRAQFRDHIPEVLDSLQQTLRAGPSQASASNPPTGAERDNETRHGLHRWQQGYRPRELTREWGHLHFAVLRELEAYASNHGEPESTGLATAHRELARTINHGITESVAEFSRLNQEEAAGHARALQRAIADLNDLERRRAELLRQAVHDLGGNVQTVNITTNLLSVPDLATEERAEYLDLLQRGVSSMTATLKELMELARLEAGQERRVLAPFDVAALLNTFCAGTQPFARERHLFLRTEGPGNFPVEGDTVKVQRIAQNLVLNALKYTEQGGVTVAWSERDADRWQLSVRDTGPGMHAGPSAPITNSLREATVTTREVEARNGERPPPDAAPQPETFPATAPRRPGGEGIGLSIVKRLCELLDASLEMESAADTGTVFRVVFPRRYDRAPASRP